MPSGYTADIYEGKDVTLRDYLMGIGRGMGFAIMQRDSPPGPVEKVEPQTSYYDESQEKAEKRIAWLNKLTPEAVAVAAREDFEEKHAAWSARIAKTKDLRARYEALLAEALDWEPPADLAGAKEMAVSQLRQSIDYDCSTSFDNEPKKREAAIWLAEELTSAAQDVEYAVKHRAEELERTAERNRYIDLFYDSLPAEIGVAR